MKEVILKDVYRLTIPYKDIYTTVYLIKTQNGDILFDAASYPEDIEECILPFAGSIDANIRYVFISHNHKDHSGGLEALLNNCPNVRVFSRSPELKEKFASFDVYSPEDGEEIVDGFKAIAVPGHTPDSMGLFDVKSSTLISGDSLQLYGIYGSGEWGANIGLVKEHIEAVNKLKGMSISSIYTAHDYHPMGYAYLGEENVKKALDFCLEPLYRIKELIRTYPEKSDEEIREIYHKENLPTVRIGIFTAVRETEM